MFIRCLSISIYNFINQYLKIAESLYNQGYISYPRTETDQFKDDFDLNSLIQIQTNNNRWGNYAQK